MKNSQLLRKIPKMDILLSQDVVKKLIEKYDYDSVLFVFRKLQEEIRKTAINIENEKKAEEVVENMLSSMIVEAESILKDMYRPHLKKVLNGTGTILHTNLGRAPLPRKLVEDAVREVCAYSNLEFDLQSGARGNRVDAIEKLICEITGAESAVIVNNNASAVILALNALSNKGETIVSRGEMVEIGGQFRIPDVMSLSGAHLVEVGTTNKTKLLDYQNAITDHTKVLLKVHTSNYRIIGFTESVSVEELCTLGVPVVEDLGSGALINLQQYGFSDEPFVQDALQRGADIVCFSGDKLLGGPQAGIIVGKKCYIEKMKSNPFYRAMRIDKITAAILEKVLLEYRLGMKCVQKLPVLRMMTQDVKSIEADAKQLKEMLEKHLSDIKLELYSSEAQVGGGSLPLTTIPSVAVSFLPLKMKVEDLDRKMRELPLPVIGRIEKGRFLIDMRTFEMEYASTFVKEVKELK